MLDIRTGLPKGTVLRFQGLSCELGKEIGRGSNALVYEGSYQDALEKDRFHHVLVKELFPLDGQGKIFRKEDGSICVEPGAEAVFQMNYESFEAGNRAHLSLLEKNPDQIGANLNTYEFNGTLYSVLGVSGGNTLAAAQRMPARSLRVCAARLLAILDALEIFHDRWLVHLDIAPDNILLLGKGNRERALLIDFNSIMDIEPGRRNEPAVLSIKQGYTAPEVRKGKFHEIGFPADMYSVTAVFYRMLTGTALTSFQTTRALPPDVSDCPCIKDEPETVKAWVQEILRRGLHTLPSRRYCCTALMRRDIEELIDRIDGIGITHWALWEAGRRQIERMVRENPSLSFIRDPAALFPAMVTDNKGVFPAEEKLLKNAESCLLLGGGGMGKTTSLLHIAFSRRKRYSPDSPAILYLSLYGWQAGNSSYIMNSILDCLHYRPQTHTYEDARKALKELLDQSSGITGKEKPLLLLLLDGLNEVADDPELLLEEINRLSSLNGIKLVVAGRTDEEALPFPRLCMTELTQKAVEGALSKEGMLLPESPEMQKLLRTPMMLSMYIQSGRMEKRQVRAGSSDELLKNFLSALEEKAVRDLSGQTDRRWQIDAAMYLALPSIASQINRKKCGLKDSELLPVVEKCYRLLNGPLSRRFFPQWIGRVAAIRGGAKNAEEWYGQTVHDILWKQLGLIVRDGQGRYTVSHQVIEEYLLKLDSENKKRIFSFHRLRILLFCIGVLIVSASSFAVYKSYIAPPPYDEADAEDIMARAQSAYVRMGKQYEQLANLNECAMNDPEGFDVRLGYYKNRTPEGKMDLENSLDALSTMLETGEVMPWSNKPMDGEACRKLLELPDSRMEEYNLFVSVLEFVMLDETSHEKYGGTYPAILKELLVTDAKISAKLYHIVCLPHRTGKYADYSPNAVSYRNLQSTVTSQNEFLKAEDMSESTAESRQALNDLEEIRDKQFGMILNCGAVDAYNETLKTD